MPGRQTISGHGSYDPDNGLFVVPKGSSITTFAEHGSTITDSLGNLIETQDSRHRVGSLLTSLAFFLVAACFWV
ncbi:putative adhesin, partial [Mycobacterium helveticum]|uniref:putative adhesin n=1 Tax=Mycobacterium helveticum TaxID=2592811 RepID=UPI001AEF4177